MLGVTAALALIVIVVAPPESETVATRVAAVVLALLAGWRFLGRAIARTRSSTETFEEVLLKPTKPMFEIPALRAAETDIRMASAHAFGVETRLKPVLRQLASWRLRRNHGVDLDRQPKAARRLMGDGLWALTQPTIVGPELRGPGVPMATLEAAVQRLEQL